MNRLILATRNSHKTREFAEILGSEFVVSDLAQVGDFPEVEETGRTFEENAILKALAASCLIADLVVADDSGLEVSALNGAPGVYSARYAGENATDQANIEKLMRELHSLGVAADRRARFRCAIALAQKGKVIATFEGAVEGVITDAPRGENGFGYDPIFVPDGYEQTFAELGAVAKNRTSHRAVAIARLREHLL